MQYLIDYLDELYMLLIMFYECELILSTTIPHLGQLNTVVKVAGIANFTYF